MYISAITVTLAPCCRGRHAPRARTRLRRTRGGRVNQSRRSARGHPSKQQSLIVGKSVFTLLLSCASCEAGVGGGGVAHTHERKRGPHCARAAGSGRRQTRSQMLCHPRAPRARQVKQNAKMYHHVAVQNERGVHSVSLC